MSEQAKLPWKVSYVAENWLRSYFVEDAAGSSVLFGPQEICEHIVEACNGHADLIHDIGRQVEIGAELATENATLTARVKELEEALGDLIAICAPNIYPKPDVGPQHPWAVLQRAREALSTSGKTGG